MPCDTMTTVLTARLRLVPEARTTTNKTQTKQAREGQDKHVLLRSNNGSKSDSNSGSNGSSKTLENTHSHSLLHSFTPSLLHSFTPSLALSKPSA